MTLNVSSNGTVNMNLGGSVRDQTVGAVNLEVGSPTAAALGVAGAP